VADLHHQGMRICNRLIDVQANGNGDAPDGLMKSGFMFLLHQ